MEQPKPQFYIKYSKSKLSCDSCGHQTVYKIITPQGWRLNKCDACLHKMIITFTAAEFIPITKWAQMKQTQAAKPKTQQLDPLQKVRCPFCLHEDNLNKFWQINPKGDLYHLCQCPECHNGMRLQTLLMDMTVETYARWVYEYAASGFWQKASFATFCRRLKEMNISYEFWQNYKRLKGENTEQKITSEEEKKLEDYRIE